jgi:hypothetical protein
VKDSIVSWELGFLGVLRQGGQDIYSGTGKSVFVRTAIDFNI